MTARIFTEKENKTMYHELSIDHYRMSLLLD